MKYIEKIILKNFQSHKDSTIELSKGLNVIVGPSDSGKTSIIRAILWILYDLPKSDSIIRAGEQFTEVLLIMRDGSYIKKTRNLNKRPAIETIIHDAIDKEEKTYHGSVDLRDKISKILGIPLDETGKESYNIHDQLSPPFLLSTTETSKAQAIGKLVGVDIIDDATQDTNSDILSKKKSITSTEKEIASIEETLKSYEDLDDIRKSLISREKLIEKIELKIDLVEKLSQYSIKMQDIRKEYLENQKFLSYYETVLGIKVVVDNIENLFQKYEYYSRLYDLSFNLSNNKTEYIAYLNRTEFIEGMLNQYEDISNKNALYLIRSPKVIELKINREAIKETSLALKENIYSKEREDEINKLSLLVEKYNALSENLRIRKKIIAEKNILKDKIESYEKLLLQEEGLAKSGEIQYKLDKLLSLSDNLNTIKNRIINGKRYIEATEDNIKKLSTQYIETLNKAKICPTCLRPIDEEEMIYIMKEYEV